MTWAAEEMGGWGNYPVPRCHVARTATAAGLRRCILSGAHGDYIPRGLGRSYGDAALNGQRGVIVDDTLDRFLGFDENTGVLECEAGVSLATIIDHALPRGWFLPTTPGTKFVT